MAKINPKDVSVREMVRDDIQFLFNYIYHSPPMFLNSIGMKTRAPETAPAFLEFWEKRFADRETNGTLVPVMTVLYRGEPIGFHTTTHFKPGQSLLIHAHFFKPEFRGMGIGTISGALAIERFLKDYGVLEVQCQIPKRNYAPMRAVEKLGLTKIGESVFESSETLEPLAVTVFRATLADLPMIKKNAGIE